MVNTLNISANNSVALVICCDVNNWGCTSSKNNGESFLKRSEQSKLTTRPAAAGDGSKFDSYPKYPAEEDDAYAQRGGSKSPFPKNWMMQRIPRPQSSSSGTRFDTFVYSPGLGIRFRGKAPALRFVALVKTSRGDEKKAFAKYKKTYGLSECSDAKRILRQLEEESTPKKRSRQR